MEKVSGWLFKAGKEILATFAAKSESYISICSIYHAVLAGTVSQEQ